MQGAELSCLHNKSLSLALAETAEKNNLLLGKLSAKYMYNVSFSTMVFARYRHLRTVDITILMWTLAYQFSVVLKQKINHSFKFLISNMERSILDVQLGKWITVPRSAKRLCHVNIDVFLSPKGLNGMYSGTLLIRTPTGPAKVSILTGCPY